jgi:tetratricopeptide (TPR) repeat protein
MEKTRLEFLQDTLAIDPENTFVRYGLAMELQNAGRATEAWTHFDHLLTHHPDYSAAYFQAAMLLIKLHRPEEARKVLERGIDVTGRQGNSHAQSELRAALDDLENSG